MIKVYQVPDTDLDICIHPDGEVSIQGSHLIIRVTKDPLYGVQEGERGIVIGYDSNVRLIDYRPTTNRVEES